jgi:hypothetical protein
MQKTSPVRTFYATIGFVVIYTLIVTKKIGESA